MDLTNVKRVPKEIQAILFSIVNNGGSNITQLVKDTMMSRDVIEQFTKPLIQRDILLVTENEKLVISDQREWRFWKEECELAERTEYGRKSLWVDESAVRDWWPLSEVPKPNLVYFIGPYREPYLSLYFKFIKPLVESVGLSCATSLEEPGSMEFLRNKILPGLKNARFVLCDLSEDNTNVHYEFGWLHAFGTPFYAFKSNNVGKRAADIHHLTINSYSFDVEGLKKLGYGIGSAMEQISIIDMAEFQKIEQFIMDFDYSEILES